MAPTRRELEDTLRAILADLFPDHDAAALQDDDDLVEALDLDSMAQIDLVLEIERRLGCHVPDEDIERLTTIRIAADYLEAALQAA
jgi:acyl carrier protein